MLENLLIKTVHHSISKHLLSEYIIEEIEAKGFILNSIQKKRIRKKN